MSIRPVDMKTSLLTADEASKMRENQRLKRLVLVNKLLKTDTIRKLELIEFKIPRLPKVRLFEKKTKKTKEVSRVGEEILRAEHIKKKKKKNRNLLLKMEYTAH